MSKKIYAIFLLFIGFACSALTGCSCKSIVAEYPSPDEKHSILVQQESHTSFLDEWSEESYAISTPGFNRQTKEFYSRTAYPGEVLVSEILDVRWIDIDHFAYGQGKDTRFCNIYTLNTLEDCSKTPPQQLKSPALITREDKLIAFASQGKAQEVRRLLKEGADIHYRTPYKNTSLIKAAEAGHLATLDMLLKAGADVNAENSLKQTGLSIAINNNHPEAVKLLLQYKAKIKDSDFISAVTKKRTKMVGHLLAAGANPNMRNGDSPIIVNAIVRGETDIVRMLLDNGAYIEARSESTGHTPLMYAALWGREDIVRLLLERGADANARDKIGRTALSEAINGVGRTTSKPNHNILELLTKGKASINANGESESVLVEAAEKGDMRLVQSLLKQGAAVDDTDKNGRTPLMGAVSFKRADIVRFLIDKGANVNALSGFNETPLQLAARERVPEICEMLLKAGAEVNAVPVKGGETALDWAINKSVADIGAKDCTAKQATYDVLRKYGGKTSQELKVTSN